MTSPTGPPVALWARMYATGLSYSEISRRTGRVSPLEIERQLRAQGQPEIARGNRLAIVSRLITRLHRQGLTTKEIAEESFRSLVYVKRILSPN